MARSNTAFGQRGKVKVAIDDLELVIIEHDLCYHCVDQRGCLRREKVLAAAGHQELSFVVTRCPEYTEA
jgi:hypothetical protein